VAAYGNSVAVWPKRAFAIAPAGVKPLSEG
jgi:hypothetical protein